MFASVQRHGGAWLEGDFDDLVFKAQRKVGATTGSTGWGNCIQIVPTKNGVHYLGPLGELSGEGAGRTFESPV